jgi:hypothetical protein
MARSLEERVQTLEQLLSQMNISDGGLGAVAALQASNEQAGNDINTSWLILTSTIVFLMQVRTNRARSTSTLHEHAPRARSTYGSLRAHGATWLGD